MTRSISASTGSCYTAAPTCLQGGMPDVCRNLMLVWLVHRLQTSREEQRKRARLLSLTVLLKTVLEAQCWQSCDPRTLEISTSYLKKAAEVLPVRCPLQKSKSTTKKRGFLCKEHEKGYQANIQITNSIFTYNIVCTP